MTTSRRLRLLSDCAAVLALCASVAALTTAGCKSETEESAPAPGANAAPGAPDSPVAADRNPNAAPEIGGAQQMAPRPPAQQAAQQQ